MFNLKLIFHSHTDTIELANGDLEFKNDDIKNRYKIQLNLDYSSIIFQFKPKFWTIIKVAWIQYLAIFIVVYAIIFKIRQIVFEDQLVDSDVQLSDNFYSLQKYFSRKL